MATLHELKTVYDAEDLYNFLELLIIDQHNQRTADAAAARDAKQHKH